MALALVRYEFRGRRAANLLIVIPTGDARGRDRLGAAVLLPDSRRAVARLPDAADRPRDVLHQLRRDRRAVTADRLRSPARGGGAGSRRKPARDLPPRDAAADHARHLRRRAARVRALDRRLRDLQLQLGHDRDVPALHLRRGAARASRSRSTWSRRSCSGSPCWRWGSSRGSSAAPRSWRRRARTRRPFRCLRRPRPAPPPERSRLSSALRRVSLLRSRYPRRREQRWRARRFQHPSRPETVRRHAEGGRARLPLEHRHRRRLDRAGLLARGDARLHRRGRAASACTRRRCCSCRSCRCCSSRPPTAT